MAVPDRDCRAALHVNTGYLMRIYMFRSETTDGLHAFAGAPDASGLPEQHGPWSASGTIGPNSAPPHKLSRAVIENAIASEGFQLWRLLEKTDA